jgi:hypothetical protein
MQENIDKGNAQRDPPQNPIQLVADAIDLLEYCPVDVELLLREADPSVIEALLELRVCPTLIRWGVKGGAIRGA